MLALLNTSPLATGSTHEICFIIQLHHLSEAFIAEYSNVKNIYIMKITR